MHDDFWICNGSCFVHFTLKELDFMHTSMKQLCHMTIKICNMGRNLLNLNHAKCLSFFVIVNLQKVAWLSLIIWGITYLVCEKDWKCHKSPHFRHTFPVRKRSEKLDTFNWIAIHTNHSIWWPRKKSRLISNDRKPKKSPRSHWLGRLVVIKLGYLILKIEF